MFFRREEAISRPKPAFVPKTLSDLNIETLSMNSGNSDGFNNNGGRFSNLNRSKANIYASHQNLSTAKKSNPDSIQNFNRNKLYGSQQSLSSSANPNNNNNNNYNNRNVNNYYSSIGDASPVDRWLNAWDDNNNFSQATPIPPPSTKTQNFNNNNLYNNININNTFPSNSNNSNRSYFKQPASANQKQIGSQKKFNDDPWSGEFSSIFFDKIYLNVHFWSLF